MNEISFSLPSSHPVFDGHFPGRPIVPGAYLLAIVQQYADQWLAQVHGDRRADARVGGVQSVKFLQPIGPDCRCVISFARTEQTLRFRIEAQGTVYANGVLSLRTS